MRRRDFRIKGLLESDEIQSSYDERDYYGVVLKSRVFLESWLEEYILALLFPRMADINDENRQFVRQRFSDMFYQIQWLLQNEYINRNMYAELNELRQFSEKVFRKGDVLTIFSLNELDHFVGTSIYYIQKFRNMTRKVIQSVTQV